MSIDDRALFASHLLDACDQLKEEKIKGEVQTYLNKLMDIDIKEHKTENLQQLIKSPRRASIPNIRHYPRGGKLKILEEALIEDKTKLGTYFFHPNELENYYVAILNGKFIKITPDGKHTDFNTLKMQSHGKPYVAAYVLNAHGKMHVFSHHEGLQNPIFHSSMAKTHDEKDQFDVIAAGEICIDQDGALVGLTHHSGHYHPTVENMYHFLEYLIRRNVTINEDAFILTKEKIPELKLLNTATSQEGEPLEFKYQYDLKEFRQLMKSKHQKECKNTIEIMEKYILTHPWKIIGPGIKIKLPSGHENRVPKSIYAQWQIIQAAKETKNPDWETLYANIQQSARDFLSMPDKISYFRKEETSQYLTKCSSLSANEFAKDLRESSEKKSLRK